MSKVVVEFDTEVFNLREFTLQKLVRLDSAIRAGYFDTASNFESLGVKLVFDERRVAKDSVRHVGFTDDVDFDAFSVYPELEDLDSHPGDIIFIQKVYKGPVEYLVALPIGDPNIQEYTAVLKPTKEEAEKLNAEFYGRGDA